MMPTTTTTTMAIATISEADAMPRLRRLPAGGGAGVTGWLALRVWIVIGVDAAVGAYVGGSYL